jgi:hypothetical protein
MGRSVEFRRDGDEGTWLFAGRERYVNGALELIIFDDDLDKCIATDLQAALRRARAYLGDHYPVHVLVAQDDEDSYVDEEHSFVHGPSFHLHNDALATSLSFAFSRDNDQDLPQAVKTTVGPLLQRHRMTIIECEPRETFRRQPFQLVDTLIGFNTRGRTLRELFDIGEGAEALIEALDGGPLTREMARDLIRAGHASVLIGQPEGHWLDAKIQHYDLGTMAGHIKLALAVARFANAAMGGLVVVGMSTTKVRGEEYIRKLSPMPRNKGVLRQYHHALKDHLFPPPDYLTIEPIEVRDDGMLILIDVPPQPEELKPFLVHGAIVDGKVHGAFISIVRRQGEWSIPVTASAIHSMLSAGRALLRRGELPPDSTG